MGKGKRNRAEREASRLAHDHTQFVEGTWLGDASQDDNPAAAALLRRFNETREGRKQCRHLTQNWDQTRFWVESVPDRLACAECTPVVAAIERERANSCCVMCGRHVALRGMSVAVHGYLLRGGVCEQCAPGQGVPG